MAGVVSVERLTITLGAGTASASANLTKSQTLANCVPFVTHRVTTVASPVDDYSETCIDVQMQSGPNRVTATTSEGTTRALVVEVTVVEFDPNRVTVQSGTYQMTGASTTASPSAVVLANTFLVHSWQIDSNPATHQHAGVRGRFTSTTQLTFDRIGTTGTVDGHWFVIESDSADFSVEEFTVTLTAATSNTATISSVTMNKTFLVGSHTISDTTDDNADGSVEIVLTNSTTVTVQRAAAGGNIVYTGYAIEFAAGGDETVQRGQIAAQGATASQNVDITAVTLDVAMVQAAGSPQSWKNGSFPGSGSSDNCDAFCAWDFVDLDTIRVQHTTSGGEASNDLAWEVIEWAVQTSEIEQEGFRWYDDGTESGSSARQNQDVNDPGVPKETTVQLRTLLDATGDPDSEQFQLEYKETADPDAEYRKVPLT